MNPAADPLKQLHPLRAPEAISWWPPAPGWWVLAGLLLLALVALAWFGLRRRRRRAYRRQALTALARIRTQYSDAGDGIACLAATNGLLKGVALRAYPRRSVAAASGGEWCEFLNTAFGDDSGFDPDLFFAQYRPQPPAGDVVRHLQLAERWIRQHRGNA